MISAHCILRPCMRPNNTTRGRDGGRMQPSTRDDSQCLQCQLEPRRCARGNAQGFLCISGPVSCALCVQLPGPGDTAGDASCRLPSQSCAACVCVWAGPRC